jgi:hypothetical protein
VFVFFSNHLGCLGLPRRLGDTLHREAAMRAPLLVAMLAAVCLTGLASVAHADVFNGRIAFSSFRVDPPPGQPRTGDIFSVTPAGKDVRRLTTNPADDAQADWSPDGTAIAYRIRRPGSTANFEVARMTAAGTEHRQLTATPTGLSSSQPTWAPDMGSIVFRRSGGSQVDSDVWTMGPLGDGPALLLAVPGHQLYPSWSPDMTRLLFATAVSPAADSDRGVYTIESDGSGLTALFDVPGAHDSAPAWSPDGTQIAFESDADPLGTNPEGDLEIFVMRADGTLVRQLTVNTLHDEGPSWAPDRTMLSYSSGPDDEHLDTHVMTAGGLHLRQLNDYAGRDESPDWQAIPAPATERRCGDLAAVGVRDVRAAGRRLRCHRARALARRWSAAGGPAHVGRFAAEQVDYGGTLRVQLVHRRRPERLVAFLAERTAR